MCMISWMIRPPCEITDQLAVCTQNCFSTLFYTPCTNIKTSVQSRMHQNVPLLDKKSKKNSGEGTWPNPQTLPHWGGGYPFPRPPSRRSAFPFLLICDSNTAYNFNVYDAHRDDTFTADSHQCHHEWIFVGGPTTSPTQIQDGGRRPY